MPSRSKRSGAAGASASQSAPAGGGKRPSYLWYPGDHKRDTAVQACGFDARALWREMLDLMHDGEPYGHLTAGGVPITPAELARIVGLPVVRVRRALDELEARKVYSRTPEGVVFSRRMAREEQKRQEAVENGRQGGNPKLLGRGPREPGRDADRGGDGDNPPLNPRDNAGDNGTVNPTLNGGGAGGGLTPASRAGARAVARAVAVGSGSCPSPERSSLGSDLGSEQEDAQGELLDVEVPLRAEREPAEPSAEGRAEPSAARVRVPEHGRGGRPRIAMATGLEVGELRHVRRLLDRRYGAASAERRADVLRQLEEALLSPGGTPATIRGVPCMARAVDAAHLEDACRFVLEGLRTPIADDKAVVWVLGRLVDTFDEVQSKRSKMAEAADAAASPVVQAVTRDVVVAHPLSEADRAAAERARDDADMAAAIAHFERHQVALDRLTAEAQDAVTDLLEHAPEASRAALRPGYLQREVRRRMLEAWRALPAPAAEPNAFSAAAAAGAAP